MDEKPVNAHPLSDREHDELIEAVDEELELEIDDDRLDDLIARGEPRPQAPHVAMDRHAYFTELLRLQRELVKLQDWVLHNKMKVVVLFEGRDAAGRAA